MQEWIPFYNFKYTSSQLKAIGWLFMMFSYNEKNSETLCPNFSQKVSKFAKSLNRHQAEHENGLSLNKTPRQLYRLTMGESPSYEVEHYRDSLANWTGQIFVMLNWKFGIPHEELAELDWNEVYQLGIAFHETSCSNACRKIIEKYNLEARGNDTRMRF